MRARILPLALIPFAVFAVACTGTDTPPDSVSNDVADADGDGLTDDEELDLGTDPENPDTDGDGFDDLAEYDAGTDGTVCWDVPEGWANCEALAESMPAPEGYGDNEVFPAFPMTDQFGDEFDSSRFSGMILFLDFSAGWCGPCQGAAPGFESYYQEHKADGVMGIQVMIDDWSNDGSLDDQDFLNDWANDFGMTLPVTSDWTYQGQYAEVYAGMYLAGTMGNGIPYFAVLDRDHRLVYHGTEAGAEAKIAELLAAE